MFLAIARSELKYMLKSPQTIVGFAIFFLLPFFAMVSSNVTIGGGGNVLVNSPFAIMQTLLIMTIFSVFLIPAYISNAVLKDGENKMDGIIFSTPISKPSYLLGRFLGSFIALCFTMTAVPIGMLFGTFWGMIFGSIDPETLAPTNLGHYVYVFLAFMVPALFVLSAIIFAITVIGKSTMYSYLAALGLLIVYFVGNRVFQDPDYGQTMALFDPIMVRTHLEVTRYWTAVERNNDFLTYDGLVLVNRALWGGVSLLLVGLAYKIFSFRAVAKLPKEKASKKGEKKPSSYKAPRVTPDWSGLTHWRQFMMRTRFEVSSVIKSLPFLIMVGFGLFTVVSALISRDVGYGIDALPVSRLMVQSLYSLAVVFIAVIIFYSADIIWRERKEGVHEFIDAAPVPSIVFAGSKLVALTVVLTIMAVLGASIAIAIQVANGLTSVEIGLYLSQGFSSQLYPLVLTAVLSVFVQTIVKNRFVGMMIMVVYLISTVVMFLFGFEHPLYLYGQGIQVRLSDLNGVGRFAEAKNWLNLYWTFFAVLLLMVSYMLWNRGTLQPLKYRLRALVALKKPVAAGIALVSLTGFVSIGGFIFYNTNILNEYRTLDDLEDLGVLYETKYRQYEDLPQPRTIEIKMDVDIFPHQGRVETRGYHLLENKTGEPINTVHLVFPDIDIPNVELEGAKLTEHDDLFNYYIFTLDTPMLAGDKRSLTFNTVMENNGFVHARANTSLVENGTFISNTNIAPHIGFTRALMIQDRNTRRQKGLDPLPRMAKLEDESQYNSNYIRQDADFVAFETTISTSADQTAVAPGYLEREWSQDNRRYFHYKMDAPILNFYSYLSADYQVAREDHNGVSIEVFHHAPHTYNVDRMIESVKDSLDYFSEAFSPYQYRQVRILEFPAYANFAQAFPNTIPYSEGIGFIANVTGEKDIDMPYYVTAHEMAHQWWGHQVMSANTQGATVLVETLAQYGALLVMEQKYGKDRMRKFLKYELDRYLAGRAGDPEGELPLYRVENQQYIHYRKGSVVMYALRDYLGEETVNRALARLIDETAFKTPYPTTLDLIRILKEEAGADHHQVISDLFERITLFDLKAKGVTIAAREDGKFAVTFTIDTEKFEADSEGVETALALKDWVDIGLFSARPDDDGFGEKDVLYFKKHLINAETKTVEIIVDEMPAFAGIDPYNKLVDRNSNDNLTPVVEDLVASAN